jgi:ESCRT-II complex subunit VPS22
MYLLHIFQEISIDDILRAIKKLKVLGNGFTVIPLGTGRFLVQSIPGELLTTVCANKKI